MSKLKEINKKRIIRVAFLMLGDIILLNLAQFLALFIRYEFVWSALIESGHPQKLLLFTPAYLILCLVVFHALGLYNSLWKFVGVQEALRIGEASVVVGIVQYFCLTMFELNVPRSFPVLNTLLLALFLAGERFSYRFLRSAYRGQSAGKTRTMLIGAGDAGAAVLRELRASERSHNAIVCIIDDDPAKKSTQLNGVPVAGSREKIAWAVERYAVEEIIFAIPTCSGRDKKDILNLCHATGCEVKTLPGIADIANGEVRLESIRNVSIEDLLGRDSIRVALDEITAYIHNKCVLVTGGGGSIGSELCRQIAQRKPGHLIIFDIYENNAYAIQQELRRTCPELNLTVLIGSVRDEARLEQVFSTYRPQIVYHAAAHKHVPLMEDSPNEAVKNNVFGTYNTANMAARFSVETFVLISTDKAVNPTNIMGATKRLCEMIVQMFARKSKTRFVAVRFGNVLGSNGSVIPLFRRQIEEGGPVTVTHPDIIRYFMTIPEAVSLVMQAGAYAKGGEIYVLDMGSPVRIDDLARNMIRLSGLEPDVDIPIVYTGLRPGEKLFEELLMGEEGLEKTANDLIFVGHLGGPEDEKLAAGLERMKSLCMDNSPAIVEEIAKLVTTYHRGNT